jgi:hypothetical protein
MKNYYLTFIFSFLLFAFNANSSDPGQDDWQSKSYPIGNFNEIYLEGTFKVRLIQDNRNLLTVNTTDVKAFDYLKVTNKGNSLHIIVDRKPFDFSRVTLFINFKELEILEILGGMKVDTEGYLDLDNLSVKVEGGAQINFKAKAGDINIVSEGGVLFNIEGVAESLDVLLTGAGHVDAGQLKTKNVSFKIEGVGTGFVNATHSLNAKIKGVGKLKYRGNPRVTKIVEGLGSVIKE